MHYFSKFFSSTVQTENQNEAFSSWMAQLKSSALQAEPLYNLCIPGSHDSGAYKLFPKLGFAVDRPDLRGSWFLNAFHFITYPLVARYSITQRLNVYQQLNAGIRYLDIRIALRPEDNQFYICHNFYGPKLEEILKQMRAYVKQNPTEIIIVDIQHVHNFKSIEDHQRLFEMISQYLRDHIISTAVFFNEPPISLQSLWSTGNQLLVFYRHPFQEMFSSLLWPSSQLPNPWANTRNSAKLNLFLKNSILSRPERKLFVTQGVLTPNSSYAIRNFFGSLETKLTQPANTLLYKLIVKDRCGCKNKNELSFGPNIVMFDFVDWNEYELLNSIVGLNRVLFDFCQV